MNWKEVCRCQEWVRLVQSKICVYISSGQGPRTETQAHRCCPPSQELGTKYTIPIC